jgi:hypothetical protein
MLDLLFYLFKLRRFVVVELKAVKFDPGMVGERRTAKGYDAVLVEAVALIDAGRAGVGCRAPSPARQIYVAGP